MRYENTSGVSKLKLLFLFRVSASSLPPGGDVLHHLRIMVVRLVSRNRKSAAPSENNEKWKDVVLELEREMRQVMQAYDLGNKNLQTALTFVTVLKYSAHDFHCIVCRGTPVIVIQNVL